MNKYEQPIQENRKPERFRPKWLKGGLRDGSTHSGSTANTDRHRHEAKTATRYPLYRKWRCAATKRRRAPQAAFGRFQRIHTV